MKNRGGGGGTGRLIFARFGSISLPSVFFLCLFFFLSGFFGFTLFSRQDESNFRQHTRLLEEHDKFEPLQHGVTGEGFLTSIPFQVLSWKPRALYFPNFATADQCEGIIKQAKKHLAPSKLMLRKGETEEESKGTRTSSGMFMGASEDKTGILEAIEEKIAKATMIPRNHGEDFNVLRYEIGQRYLSHYDSFDPAQFGPQKSQRVASFLLYLSDVDEGGETVFPFEDGQNMDANFDYSKCIGIKVKPRRGDGLLFYSLFSNGTSDRTSLHGSCPVIRGQKWVATKWLRDQVNED